MARYVYSLGSSKCLGAFPSRKNFGNFQWQMEQHFPEFLEERTTLGGKVMTELMGFHCKPKFW